MRVVQLAAECRKQGIGIHLYYSLVDWGRADYGWKKPLSEPGWSQYITFMKTQLTELITQYPNVEAIWFDGHWDRKDANWHYDEIYTLIHHLNPKILIGNNHHLAPITGEDFQMFEKDLPGESCAKNVLLLFMNIETIRAICTSLPAVTEGIKWENDLCFMIAGKMFCVAGLHGPFTASFKVKDEEFDALSESPGMIPAPYVARYKWVLVQDPTVLDRGQWEHYIRQSYELVRSKLSKKQLAGLS